MQFQVEWLNSSSGWLEYWFLTTEIWNCGWKEERQTNSVLPPQHWLVKAKVWNSGSQQGCREMISGVPVLSFTDV
jgi:hypothetical protein